jgi:hypothetical protein
VIGGMKLKMGIKTRKIPKSTIPKIAIDNVETTGKISLLRLRDFKILSFPIRLVNPPEVPLTNKWKNIIPEIRYIAKYSSLSLILENTIYNIVKYSKGSRAVHKNPR